MKESRGSCHALGDDNRSGASSVSCSKRDETDGTYTAERHEYDSTTIDLQRRRTGSTDDNRVAKLKA